MSRFSFPLSLALVISLFGASPALAQSFSDVPSTHPNFDAIQYLEPHGIVQGYSDGTFKPDNTINRAEFLKILIEAQYFDGRTPESRNCPIDLFVDVPNTEWYAKYICLAKSEGIVKGYADGTFKPSQTITFAEAAKIVVNTMIEKMEDGSGERWYEPFVQSLSNKKIIPITILSLNKKVTRGELVEMIYRMMTTSADTSDFSVYENGELRVLVVPLTGKPVIYFYPQKEQEISITLDYKGEIIADYPSYNKEMKGWKIKAFPDGRIINLSDNKEYSYIFWEGIENPLVQWDMSTGFVIKGSESREFLQDILPKMGLTPKEYNEFIVYWYPLLQKNPYNLIHFSKEQYEDLAKMSITPKPDALLRVFMVFKPLEKFQEISPQVIVPFERKGFTVVEWGGTEVQ